MTHRHLPKTLRKIIATKLSQKFRDVAVITEVPMPVPGEGEVLIKNRYAGINASDINYSAGRYDSSVKPPIDCGFEGLGEVVSVGSNTSLQVGQPVMYAQFGAFSDYKVVSERRITKIPKILPQFLPFQVSGATAAIALDKLGELKPGEKVIVTAAAGGTGQFAVQWAKQAGCHVIGTCSTDEKVEFLRKIGCDRPINYKKENLKEVLKTEYKAGIDVVYESVGGDTFEICFNSLATKGRLIVIGFIEGYESNLGFKPSRFAATLPVRLLNKSASIKGFFLEHFRKDWQTYVSKMSEMYDAGKLKSFIDLGENTPKGPFVGLEKVNDAVEHLYTKNSVGKIMVDLSGAENSKL